ncbi:hypothetical protein CK203_094116 [Vitis vinifera]|uniref:Uncharacterized protein n=1 Tax=Vitis vinifera TaxID=29760 RepID=A0A438CXL1_VITVI|nr:hypothetical protein CK203_094116 [Vitis vinifera]
MASYLSLKMKRKELEEVNDDFSDFSLSSPPEKFADCFYVSGSRRMDNQTLNILSATEETFDAELPPIMEEEEMMFPVEFEQLLPEKQVENTREEVDGIPLNAERAIVLFKPVNSPLMQSPSKFSVSVDSDIISGFKNQFPWSSQPNLRKSVEDETASGERNTRVPQIEAVELMEEAEEMEVTTMDIEDNNLNPEQQQEHGFGGMRGSESLHQWQQQHCMTPQLPQNMSTPITWFR